MCHHSSFRDSKKIAPLSFECNCKNTAMYMFKYTHITELNPTIHSILDPTWLCGPGLDSSRWRTLGHWSPSTEPPPLRGWWCTVRLWRRHPSHPPLSQTLGWWYPQTLFMNIKVNYNENIFKCQMHWLCKFQINCEYFFLLPVLHKRTEKLCHEISYKSCRTCLHLMWPTHLTVC